MFGLFSDSGFGSGLSGAAGYSSSSSKKDYENSDTQRKVDLDGLTPFEKNFYVESENVAKMTEREVEEYRTKREITVEGRDVPKPIKTFSDARFPGNRHLCLLLFIFMFIFHSICGFLIYLFVFNS